MTLEETKKELEWVNKQIPKFKKDLKKIQYTLDGLEYAKNKYENEIKEMELKELNR